MWLTLDRCVRVCTHIEPANCIWLCFHHLLYTIFLRFVFHSTTVGSISTHTHTRNQIFGQSEPLPSPPTYTHLSFDKSFSFYSLLNHTGRSIGILFTFWLTTTRESKQCANQSTHSPIIWWHLIVHRITSVPRSIHLQSSALFSSSFNVYMSFGVCVIAPRSHCQQSSVFRCVCVCVNCMPPMRMFA